jgi:hypothetical protein
MKLLSRLVSLMLIAAFVVIAQILLVAFAQMFISETDIPRCKTALVVELIEVRERSVIFTDVDGRRIMTADRRVAPGSRVCIWREVGKQ